MHKAMNRINVTTKVVDAEKDKLTTQVPINKILKETDDHTDTKKVLENSGKATDITAKATEISQKDKIKISPTVAPTQEEIETTTQIPNVIEDTFTTASNLEKSNNAKTMIAVNIDDTEQVEATTYKTVEIDNELKSRENEIKSVHLGEIKPAHRPLPVDIQAIHEDTNKHSSTEKIKIKTNRPR